MFRGHSKIIAYILTMSMLAGTCSIPALAASDDEPENTAVESVVVEEDEQNGDGQQDDEQTEDLGEDTAGQNQDDEDQGQITDDQGKDDEVDGQEQDNDGNGQNQGGEGDGQNQGNEGGNQNQNGNEDGGQDDPVQDPDPEAEKIDLSEAELFIDEDIIIFDGSAPHPEILVSLEGITLTEGTDYEVIYDESADVGTHVVTINGIGDYTGSAQIEYRIEKRAQKVSGTQSYTKRLDAQAFQLNAVTDGDGALVFGSSNNKVVTVSSSGKVTVKGTGTAVISVYAKETENCGKSNVLKVTVKILKNKQEVSVTATYKKSLGQAAFKVKASTNGNGTLKFSSSNSKVAVVDKTGKVTLKGMGIAKIKVYATETSTFEKSATKTITIKVAPKKMTVSSVKNTANNKLTVNWKKQSGVSGYQIQYSAKKDFSKAKTVSATSSTVSKVISGLTKNATYYVRIRPYKTVGSEKLYSDWSAAKSVKISKGTVKTFGKTPSITVTGENGGLKNTVSWKKLSGASGYEVYFKKGSSGTWSKAGSTTGVSYIHSVTHGVRYYYKVRAYQELADGSRIYGKYSGEKSKLQYFSPKYSVVMSDDTKSSTSGVAMAITNNGVGNLRIYSKDAVLMDDDYSKYDRLLYLSNTRRGKVDISEAKYIDIKPGTTEIIAFIVKGDDTWYDERTTVGYKFRYDGVNYKAISSCYYGTHYEKE